MAADRRDLMRVAVAEYEHHQSRAGAPDGDPDAFWWYAAWAASVVPLLKELVAEGS